MKLAVFFAGDRSIEKEAEKMGINTFSIDYKDYENIDLVKDVEYVTIKDIPFIPDVVWGSPDCTTYSIAACSTHRIDSITPKSEYAEKCDRVNYHFLELIREWLLINPSMKYFIENPRGMMRKMPFMQGIPRATVTYCQYGDDRMKPTDIWSNHIYSLFRQDGWMPRPICKNGDTCHVSAPRGAKTGTQGRKGSYERSKIPAELCREILDSCRK